MQMSLQTQSEISGRRSGYDRRAPLPHHYRGIERRTQRDRRTGARYRLFSRFRPKDLTFVRLFAESREDMGQLMDIGLGGLSLRYFVDADKTRNYEHLGIFSMDADINIARIPFQTVSDTQLRHSPFSTIILRRQGIRFENLTSDQQNKLDYFLSNCTLGEA